MKKTLAGLGLVALGAGIGVAVCAARTGKIKDLADNALDKVEKLAATILTRDLQDWESSVKTGSES